eukprot:CAMPEP_0178925740 /NCGR_PEP_ID=MMETSP0786-20121207/18100_1 /TAXON_ID=186022 /ORGANISM="Thalassionema frauenfeldii, Strain CCMP 1798" /LENGTH=188 /DNA_ID=CAMNT_0020600695 /DNA_START=76 /DNA_END=639 /DNA_ORIENTATION=-
MKTTGNETHQSAMLLQEHDDLLLVIMNFIDFPTLTRIQRVSTYWKMIVCQAIPRRLGNRMFLTKKELIGRIREYCADKAKFADGIASTYGWPIGNWNVSQITDFSRALQNESNFNEDIRTWNISNATTLRRMFYCARSFNQDLSRWNTSNVADMAGMFKGAKSFNGNIAAWDVRNVKAMDCMFEDAKS